jgi:glycopeptide antibiotics resistance protein
MATLFRCSRVLGIVALLIALGLIINSPRYFVGHAHWRRIVWIPFSEAHLSPKDIMVNLLVFFPFGFLWGFGSPASPRTVWRSGVLVLGLSISCEFYQVFCHERFPSATDVVDNTLGALAGLTLGSAFSKRSAKLLQPAR